MSDKLSYAELVDLLARSEATHAQNAPYFDDRLMRKIANLRSVIRELDDERAGTVVTDAQLKDLL